MSSKRILAFSLLCFSLFFSCKNKQLPDELDSTSPHERGLSSHPRQFFEKKAALDHQLHSWRKIVDESREQDFYLQLTTNLDHEIERVQEILLEEMEILLEKMEWMKDLLNEFMQDSSPHQASQLNLQFLSECSLPHLEHQILVKTDRLANLETLILFWQQAEKLNPQSWGHITGRAWFNQIHGQLSTQDQKIYQEKVEKLERFLQLSEKETRNIVTLYVQSLKQEIQRLSDLRSISSQLVNLLERRSKGHLTNMDKIFEQMRFLVKMTKENQTENTLHLTRDALKNSLEAYKQNLEGWAQVSTVGFRLKGQCGLLRELTNQSHSYQRIAQELDEYLQHPLQTIEFNKIYELFHSIEEH